MNVDTSFMKAISPNQNCVVKKTRTQGFVGFLS